MKKLINVFFLATTILFVANTAKAQQKIAHLNSDDIYANMPEAKTAQTTLETLAKTKQAELEKMNGEYQLKYKAAQDKEKTISEANREVVSKELQEMGTTLQDMQKRLQDAQTKAQQDIEAKKGELFPPISQKVANAINAVAKEKGLSYVYDVSAQQGFNNLVYFDGGDDITAAVKTKLGIVAAPKPVAPATKQPVAPAPKKN